MAGSKDLTRDAVEEQERTCRSHEWDGITKIEEQD
jgi:hypothetical protein